MYVQRLRSMINSSLWEDRYIAYYLIENSVHTLSSPDRAELKNLIYGLFLNNIYDDEKDESVSLLRLLTKL